jgi:hypothetical protein
MIEVRLRGMTRKFKCLLPLVTNHGSITTGFSAAASWGMNTRADRNRQHQCEHHFHGSLREIAWRLAD